jgi:hypothetical protein
VPPLSSSGFNLLSRARPAISLTSVEIYSSPFKLTFYTTGAIKPCSVWTANDMFTFLNCLMKSFDHELFVAGTLIAAIDAAFMTKSFTDNLTAETLLNLALIFIKLSTCTCTVT